MAADEQQAQDVVAVLRGIQALRHGFLHVLLPGRQILIGQRLVAAVVPHLVERETKDDGLENAVRRALMLMRGLFALVLISADDPEKIVTVRNGPPIVVGLGDHEFFVASDIPAILSHTRDVVFLGDEEMAIITRSGVEFTDFFGRPVSKATQRVLWDPIMAEKAGYKHFMLKEIFEQPTAARETILGRVSQDSGKVFLEEMKITDAQFAAVEKITILA